VVGNALVAPARRPIVQGFDYLKLSGRNLIRDPCVAGRVARGASYSMLTPVGPLLVGILAALLVLGILLFVQRRGG